MKDNAANVRAYRERHAILGLCRSCPRPAIPGRYLCEPCAEGVPPVTGPHGYVLSDAECRQAARCSRAAWEALDRCDPDDADSLLGAHEDAYSALDAGFPWEFWHCNAEGKPHSAIARELAQREKRAEQTLGL